MLHFAWPPVLVSASYWQQRRLLGACLPAVHPRHVRGATVLPHFTPWVPRRWQSPPVHWWRVRRARRAGWARGLVPTAAVTDLQRRYHLYRHCPVWQHLAAGSPSTFRARGAGSRASRRAARGCPLGVPHDGAWGRRAGRVWCAPPRGVCASTADAGALGDSTDDLRAWRASPSTATGTARARCPRQVAPRGALRGRQ